MLQEHWILTLLLTLSLLVYLHYVTTFSKFKKFGLPGPTPWPLLGNSVNFILKKKPTHVYFTDLVKKYGRVFGLYVLNRPTIIVSDADMLKSLLVKDFENFQDRPVSIAV